MACSVEVAVAGEGEAFRAVKAVEHGKGADDPGRRYAVDETAQGIGDIQVAVPIHGEARRAVKAGSEGTRGAVGGDLADRIAVIVCHIEVAVTVERQRIWRA